MEEHQQQSAEISSDADLATLSTSITPPEFHPSRDVLSTSASCFLSSALSCAVVSSPDLRQSVHQEYNTSYFQEFSVVNSSQWEYQTVPL
jgi:hypothetical protein